MWEIISGALKSLTYVDILTSAGIYIANPLVVHTNIQFVKYDRRERNLPELGRWTLRGLALVGCSAVGTFIGWRLGGWTFEDSINHGFNIGLAYPFAMWLYMAWVKKTNLDAYRKLIAPRRRTDDDDPDTTWSGET